MAAARLREAVITGSPVRARDGAGPGPGLPGELARQIQALFAEARRRRRRRRLMTAAAALAAVALAGAAVIGYQAAGQHAPGATRHGTAVPARVPRVTLPSAFVAWFDTNGALRIGDVATLAERPVAQVAGQPCCRLVTAGSTIYWAGQSGGRDYVQAYDLATGQSGNLAPGWAVFASASGRNVYIAQSARRLLMLPVGGLGPARLLVTPPGWQVAPLSWAAAGAIMLASGVRHQAIGVWHPQPGSIQVIGHGYVLATWTQPSGRGGLIAWQPAACPPRGCPLEITSIPAGRTRTVRSPLPHGFLGQGGDMAFSPDGTQLAALVSVGPLNPLTEPRFAPALVNTATGAVRPVRHAMLANGEQAGWLVWLPGPGRLLVGPAADISRYAGYAIDARTATASPFTFFPGPSHLANAPSDITYSVVLIPAPPRGYRQLASIPDARCAGNCRP